MNTYSYLQEWFENERSLNENEIEVLNLLLSKPFKEKHIIQKQIESTKVNGRCTCGCLSVNLNPDKRTEKYPYEFRVPIEMEVSERGELVLVLLHIVDGYVNELEILRADSEPIVEKLELTNKKIIIKSELEEESNSV